MEYPRCRFGVEACDLLDFDSSRRTFDLDAFGQAVRSVNPTADVLLLSAATGQGMRAWYDWIDSGPDVLGERRSGSTRSIDKANPSE